MPSRKTADFSSLKRIKPTRFCIFGVFILFSSLSLQPEIKAKNAKTDIPILRIYLSFFGVCFITVKKGKSFLEVTYNNATQEYWTRKDSTSL
ncbi:hypothetical protein PT2222_140388 [Paraburkholderia tropica]